MMLMMMEFGSGLKVSRFEFFLVFYHFLTLGGEAEYANWNDQAVPEHKSFNCMQLLSGTVYEGEWMTILCGEDNYTSALSLCQLN